MLLFIYFINSFSLLVKCCFTRDERVIPTLKTGVSCCFSDAPQWASETTQLYAIFFTDIIFLQCFMCMCKILKIKKSAPNRSPSLPQTPASLVQPLILWLITMDSLPEVLHSCKNRNRSSDGGRIWNRMCFLSTEAWEPILLFLLDEFMTLKMSIMFPLM